ncbi:MAG: DUF5615 family PIN-like protein [Actinobacteria bacterium]|nr:DUF5615 family PIN-like protein [Actinomycetota bacterium]
MKLLFDQNLSRRLVDHVRDVFPESSHVALQGLAEATDDEVWAFAAARGSDRAARASREPRSREV